MARRIDKKHPEAEKARRRVRRLIDEEPAERLAEAVRKRPSLRGMVAGYLAESRLETEILLKTDDISDVKSPDEHDRTANKADREFTFLGKRFRVQVKSIQTNSIGWDAQENQLVADVQNDASDRRPVKIKATGHTFETTCYHVGDYDILAVLLYPFTGDWTFAFKRNKDCRRTTSGKYPIKDRKYLLSTIEKITFPLEADWSSNLMDFLSRWK